MSLEVRNLSKYYGKKKALDKICVTFEEGKIYGLLGRNGAGKTTLFNIIANRIFTSYGDVLLDGESTEENDRALAKLFLVNSDDLYPKHISVQKAFSLTKRFYPEFSEEKALVLAKNFNLDICAKTGALSTGYKTIFKDIIALSMHLPYVLMDEPALGLDANHRDMLYQQIIAEYSTHPRTFILSTHLIDEIAAVIEDVVILDNGHILADESCDSLLQRGYTATGPASLVEQFSAGKHIIGKETLGTFCSVCILDETHKTTAIPEGIEISAMDLQKLFVTMTNEAEGST